MIGRHRLLLWAALVLIGVLPVLSIAAARFA